MVFSKTSLILSAVILILAISSIFFWVTSNSLRTELSNEQSEKATLVSNIAQLNTVINQQRVNISTLTTQLANKQKELDQVNLDLLSVQQELEELQLELEDASTSLEEAQAEFESLKEEVEDVENTIEESMSWFEDNAQLPESMGSSFTSNLQSKCVDSDQLNLACIEHMMMLKYGFHYISDRKDRLFTLEEMAARHGGDCEDYSLFMKAILNSYKEMDPGVELLGWAPGSGEFIFYESSSRYWYYNGDGVELGELGDLYPTVVCYVTSYSSSGLMGHCVVALSDSDINSAEDIYALDGADVFEPQSGEYLGEISTDSDSDQAFNICTGDENCGTNVNDLIIIITNNDYYKMENGEWEGFSTALESIEEFLAELENTQ